LSEHLNTESEMLLQKQPASSYLSLLKSS